MNLGDLQSAIWLFSLYPKTDNVERKIEKLLTEQNELLKEIRDLLKRISKS